MLRFASTALLALLIGHATFADGLDTDVNIVTALDISNSIALQEFELELEGVAQAIRDPRVLRAIQAGQHRRIGFAVFAWHHDSFPRVLTWTIIGSQDDARAVARQIEARGLIDFDREARESVVWYIGRLTDLSQAIDYAGEMIRTAPFAARRSVINVIGNGKDNVAEDAGPSRDRVVEGGSTINGLVLGNDPAATDYYRQQVIGGPGAFVMTITDTATVTDTFARKFIGDIVAQDPRWTSAPESIVAR